MKTVKILFFIGLGAAFWFNAAMIIRLSGTTVFTANNPKLLLFYLIAIPITLLSLYITKLVSKLKYAELLKPVVIMTFTATFLDAIALTCFRELYSPSFEVTSYGAAWILWGVGLGLLFAFYLSNKNKRHEI